MGGIMQSLPAWFVQCHKSYIVNLRQIQRFGTNDILLKNGNAVPVSRAKYKQTKEAHFNFVGGTF
jgi:DNA-binding LytR/AlgR family response regulator